MTRYWHGGAPGRQRGAFLLPPALTGASSCSEFGAAGVHRRDRVYLTTSYQAALMYAATVKGGVVYLCEPIGELEPDPDCKTPGLSWQCTRARVKKCIKPKAWERELVQRALLEDECNRIPERTPDRAPAGAEHGRAGVLSRRAWGDGRISVSPCAAGSA